MDDQYYINFQEFSLERLKTNLATGDVLPARQILRDDIDERFEIFKSLGFHNLNDLIEALSTKKKIEKLSRHGFPIEYLVILRREVRSYIPKPVYLREIPGIGSEDVEKLAAAGITHSKHVFERGQTKKKREELSVLTGVSIETLLEIAKLSDLARVRGIGAVFTRLFYESGADTIENLSKWDPEHLFQVVHAVNKEKNITQAVPPLKDFKQYVEIANDLPKVMEFD
jgi:predicted flap endonuclease-1-like 5' DNA nuclease